MNNVVSINASSAGRPRAKDGRVRFAHLPRGCGYGARFLYAFGLDDGLTKIGITCQPRKRICDHWKKFGKRITWVHVFSPIPFNGAMRLVERDALMLAGMQSTRIGTTELFHGLSRDAALACVRQAIAAASDSRAKAVA